MNRPAFGILALCGVISTYAGAGMDRDLASFFPAACGSWQAADSLRLFTGEKLYDLVDGGADIYLEYGFLRAGAQHYSGPHGGEISVEVHEMSDTTAAWGIYSFLAAETGVAAVFGQEGVEGEDFVIFWKGRFVVLVSAINDEGRAGLAELADEVSRRIPPAGSRPDLAEILLRPEFHNDGVLFMKGMLAFDRRAELGTGNIFRFEEAVSGIYGGCTTMVLRYSREGDCGNAAREGIQFLCEKLGYRNRAGSGLNTVLSGPGGKLIRLKSDRRYLLLVIGEDEANLERVSAALARAVGTLTH